MPFAAKLRAFYFFIPPIFLITTGKYIHPKINNEVS